VWPKHVAWYNYQTNKGMLTEWFYTKLLQHIGMNNYKFLGSTLLHVVSSLVSQYRTTDCNKQIRVPSNDGWNWEAGRISYECAGLQRGTCGCRLLRCDDDVVDGCLSLSKDRNAFIFKCQQVHEDKNHLGLLTLEDATDRLSRNVGKELPLIAKQ